MEFTGKLMNQTWENGGKPYFGHDFGLSDKIWAPKIFYKSFTSIRCWTCRKLSSFAISGKTYDPNSRKLRKPHFGPDLGPLGANSGRQILFQKIWLHHSLDIMASYRHVQYQKKLMIQSKENLVTDGQTDWRTDRQMDESDLLDRYASNVGRPTYSVSL